MPRPKRKKRINFDPNSAVFKPKGQPMRELEVIHLTKEEAEALRLKNMQELTQTEAAEKMDTSQSTFQRILSSGYGKVTEAIIEGKAIKIKKE